MHYEEDWTFGSLLKRPRISICENFKEDAAIDTFVNLNETGKINRA